jgi:hypothetical protein
MPLIFPDLNNRKFSGSRDCFVTVVPQAYLSGFGWLFQVEQAASNNFPMGILVEAQTWPTARVRAFRSVLWLSTLRALHLREHLSRPGLHVRPVCVLRYRFLNPQPHISLPVHPLWARWKWPIG